MPRESKQARLSRMHQEYAVLYLPFRKLTLPFRCAFCRSSHANGYDRSTSCTSALWRLLYLTVAFRSRAIPDSLLRTSGTYSAGWSSLVARRAHNPEVVGSNPAPATIHSTPFFRTAFFLLMLRGSKTTNLAFRRFLSWTKVHSIAPQSYLDHLASSRSLSQSRNAFLLL